MHLRVINPTNMALWEGEVSEAYGRAASPDTKVSVSTLFAGPPTLESRRDIAVATPWIIQAAIEAEAEGCDAIAVDCMLDPGVAAVREAVAIPVLGPAQASMQLASMLGHRFSLLSLAPDDRRDLWRERARRYGVNERLTSIRSIGIPVLEIDADLDRAFRAATSAVRDAVVDDGADTVVVGCTGLIGFAPRIHETLLEQGLDVAVIDPPSAVVRQLETIFAMGLLTGNAATGRQPERLGWPSTTNAYGIVA